jgi:hypothetical protein
MDVSWGHCYCRPVVLPHSSRIWIDASLNGSQIWPDVFCDVFDVTCVLLNVFCYCYACLDFSHCLHAWLYASSHHVYLDALWCHYYVCLHYHGYYASYRYVYLDSVSHVSCDVSYDVCNGGPSRISLDAWLDGVHCAHVWLVETLHIFSWYGIFCNASIWTDSSKYLGKNR